MINSICCYRHVYDYRLLKMMGLSNEGYRNVRIFSAKNDC